MRIEVRPGQTKLHFSLIFFLVSLLLTFLAWDHYFNSSAPIDRTLVSTLVLVMGVLFSASSGFFLWSLEKSYEALREAYRKLEEAQQELIQAEKNAVIGRIVSAIIHDLRNPLVSIMGFTHLILESPQEGEVRKHAEIVHREAERCHKIVQDLAAFAREKKIPLTPVNFSALLEEIFPSSFTPPAAPIQEES